MCVPGRGNHVRTPGGAENQAHARGRDTGLSQLFVTLRPTPHLVGEYSLVGEAEPGWERLAAGDRILKVRVLEATAK